MRLMALHAGVADHAGSIDSVAARRLGVEIRHGCAHDDDLHVTTLGDDNLQAAVLGDDDLQAAAPTSCDAQ